MSIWGGRYIRESTWAFSNMIESFGEIVANSVILNEFLNAFIFTQGKLR